MNVGMLWVCIKQMLADSRWVGRCLWLEPRQLQLKSTEIMLQALNFVRNFPANNSFIFSALLRSFVLSTIACNCRFLYAITNSFLMLCCNSNNIHIHVHICRYAEQAITTCAVAIEMFIRQKCVVWRLIKATAGTTTKMHWLNKR